MTQNISINELFTPLNEHNNQFNQQICHYSLNHVLWWVNDTRLSLSVTLIRPAPLSLIRPLQPRFWPRPTSFWPRPRPPLVLHLDLGPLSLVLDLVLGPYLDWCLAAAADWRSNLRCENGPPSSKTLTSITTSRGAEVTRSRAPAPSPSCRSCYSRLVDGVWLFSLCSGCVGLAEVDLDFGLLALKILPLRWEMSFFIVEPFIGSINELMTTLSVHVINLL